MADFNSSLPIRTENAGDAIVKIADATVTSQQLKVEADGSINVNSTISATNLDIRDLVFATDKVDVTGSEVSLDATTLAALENITVSATNLDIRDLTSVSDSVSVLQATHDNLNLNANIQVGNADVANGNPVPISDAGGSITVDGSVTVSATNLDIRDLAFATDKVDVSGSSVTVTATDLDIRDLSSATDSVTVVATNLDVRDLTHASDSIKIGDGTDFLAVNTDGSINVVIADASPGTAINDYNSASAIAGGATSNHDYTSAGNFYLNQIHAASSGKMKIEVLVNAVSKFVFFSSTANPNMDITLANPILATSGQVVRIIRTNKEGSSQDLYSTISGYQL
jgi:hypothetical protein